MPRTEVGRPARPSVDHRIQQIIVEVLIDPRGVPYRRTPIRDWRDDNIREFDLSGGHMVGWLLSGADCANSRFDGADLTDADLSGANLGGASLRDAKLVRANLTGADLTGADLEGADLTGAILDGARLPEAVAEGC